MSTTEARYVIRDEGSGFDTSKVPDPGDLDVREREGGRGRLLRQTFMDEGSCNEAGNEVRTARKTARS